MRQRTGRIANVVFACVLLVSVLPRATWAAESDAARQAAAALVEQATAFRACVFAARHAAELRDEANDLLAGTERYRDGVNDDAGSSAERNQRLLGGVNALIRRAETGAANPRLDVGDCLGSLAAMKGIVKGLAPSPGPDVPTDPPSPEPDYDVNAVRDAVNCALAKAKAMQQELADQPQAGDRFAALVTDVNSIVSLLEGMKSQVEQGVKRSVLRKTLKAVRGKAKQIAGKMRAAAFGDAVSLRWNDLQNAVTSLAAALPPPASNNNAALLEAAQEKIAEQAESLAVDVEAYAQTLQTAEQDGQVKAMRKALASLTKSLGRVKARADDGDADADAIRKAINEARAAHAAAAQHKPSLQSPVIAGIGEALDAMRAQLP